MLINLKEKRKNLYSLSLLTLVILLLSSSYSLVAYASGYNWTQTVSSFGNGYCYSLASSDDGKYVACANYGDSLRISSDYGATWTAEATTPSETNWYGVGVSSTGQYMVADSYNGNIFLSINYGTTWTVQSSPGINNWNTAAISGNGQYIAVINGLNTTNGMAVSNNYGATWTLTTPFTGEDNMYTLAMSRNGQYLVASGINSGSVNTAGWVWVSNDYGSSWVKQTALGQSNSWYIGSGISASGQYLFVDQQNGNIVYRSSDYGSTWTLLPNLPTGTHYWLGLTTSSDGSRIILNDGNTDGFYESLDYGNTWTQDSFSTGKAWWTVAGSADLSHAVEIDYSGDVYYSFNPSLVVTPPSPTPAIPSQTTLSNTTTTLKSPNTGFGEPSNSNLLEFVVGIISISSFTVGYFNLRNRKRIFNGQK